MSSNWKIRSSRRRSSTKPWTCQRSAARVSAGVQRNHRADGRAWRVALLVDRRSRCHHRHRRRRRRRRVKRLGVEWRRATDNINNDGKSLFINTHTTRFCGKLTNARARMQTRTHGQVDSYGQRTRNTRRAQHASDTRA